MSKLMAYFEWHRPFISHEGDWPMTFKSYEDDWHRPITFMRCDWSDKLHEGGRSYFHNIINFMKIIICLIRRGNVLTDFEILRKIFQLYFIKNFP